MSTAGIPHHEFLTVWAHRRTWIDQQRLAQLLFYRAYGVGAVRGARAELADDRHPDFVLWESPGLAGRLIADVRFELLDGRELSRLARFERGPRAARTGRRAALRPRPEQQALGPRRRRGWKVPYADPSMSVLEL